MLYLFLGIGILVTIGLSFFFSMSETALLSLNRYRIRFLAENKTKRADFLLTILNHPEKVLSPILLGNTLANTATAMLTSYLIAILTTREILHIQNEIAQAIASVAIAVTILIFGEITPKTLAARQPEKYAFRVILPIRGISWLLSPVIHLSMAASRVLLRLFIDVHAQPPLQRLSIEELKAILTHYSDSNISPESLEMIHKLFEFANIPVREVMVPRSRVVMVDIGSNLDEIVAVFQQHDFSTVPIYETVPENIVGVVRLRDLFRRLAQAGPGAPGLTLRQVVSPVTFVPETASIDDILKQFRITGNRFAVVVDELGQYEGAVTIEDVLEEIVGEIQRMSDAGHFPIHRLEPGQYSLEGLLPIREFNRFFPEPLPSDETYATLAGFLMDQLGRVPELHQTLNWGNYQFYVLEVSDRQVRRVRLSVLEHPAPPSSMDVRS